MSWPCDTNVGPGMVSDYDTPEEKEIARLTTKVARLQSELAEARKNAKRYLWLRDHKCNSLNVSHNDDFAPNYTTAKRWIEEDVPEDFEDTPSEEIQKMKDTNTIWRLQIYPDTPVGFCVWFAATLDAVIDAAIDSQKEKGK